jgi:DNA-binding transcriptional LysR family regulator
MVWLGDENLVQREVLPIAVLEQPCRSREAALSALESVDRSYRIVVETPNLSALRAAVASRLAVTCRTEVFRQNEIPLISSGLPRLPRIAYLLRSRPAPPPAAMRLAQLIERAVNDLD